MKFWLFIFLKALIFASTAIKERFLHIQVDSLGKAKLKDHVKYYNIKPGVKIEKTIFIEMNNIKNITVNIDKPNKISNISIHNVSENLPINSTKLKKREGKASVFKIEFNCEVISKENIFIVTYEYELSNFFTRIKDKKGFNINFDKHENIKQPYKFEIKIDIDYNSLFGLDVPVQLLLENEDNYKWKSRREEKEFHAFIQYLKKNNHNIKGSIAISNFDRNDKFSYSHSHNDYWDFKDWYHHHGHATKNYGNENGGNVVLDMGFAFLLLFGIFGCIFYPIVCFGEEDHNNTVDKSHDCYNKMENII